MSISSTTRKAGPFAGNGVQTVFPFTFKVFQNSDVVVTRAVAGVETILALGADYAVALNADQDAAPGGNVTLTAGLAVGASLALTSGVQELQPVTVTNAGGFFPAVFNTVFDRLTILVQQLVEKISRTVTIPVTASGVTSLQIPVVAGGVLQWKSDGSALQALALPDLSLSLALPAQAGKAGLFLSTNGATTSWVAAVVAARQVLTSGLATGGGDLSADRTVAVPAAAASDVTAGTSSTKAAVPSALSGSAAFAALTDAATVAWDVSTGYNKTLTLTAAGHTIGAPTNLIDGLTYVLDINPGAFGNPSWNAIWDFGAAAVPVFPASVWSKVTAQYNSARGKLEAGVWKGA